MSGKPQIDGCRVVALGDAWAYGQGQITWNELEARAHAAPAEAQPVPPSAPVGVEGLIAEWKMLIAHPDTSTIMRATLENVVIRLQHALAQQPAAVDGGWRKKAAEWLESMAVEQEAANQRWPKHAACYKEWRDRPGILRHLAFQVLAAQQGGES